MNNVEIYFERCKGCYLCIDACPTDALEVGNRMNATGCYPVQQVEGAKCNACGQCATVCPDAGIEVYREVKSA